MVDDAGAEQGGKRFSSFKNRKENESWARKQIRLRPWRIACEQEERAAIGILLGANFFIYFVTIFGK
jgi:hypothetical protein